MNFFTSLWYKYIKIWYFHGLYKAADGLGTKIMPYHTFNLLHVSKVAAHFSEEKKDVHMVIQVSKQRKRKRIKTRLLAVFRTLPNIYDGAFLRNYNS